MRLLVCGGRDFDKREEAYTLLDDLHRRNGITCIIEGGARGADRIAGDWARERGVASVRFPADWATNGRAAGHIRNAQMLREGRPDTVLAFPGGRGTANMVQQARKALVMIIHAKERP